MRASKRILSLVLSVMMVLSVITVGFVNANAATVPIVPRTPDVAPNPTFTVPGYLTTYGTNEYLPGTKVLPVVKGISFYLDGATNVSLTTTSSVAYGTNYTSGNTTYWDITGGTATANTIAEFTVSYTYNGKTWISKAYSWVCEASNDATIVNRQRQNKPTITKDAYAYHALWVTPTMGKFEGYNPTLVTSGSGSGYFIPESHSFTYDASSTAAAYYWHRNDSASGSTEYTMGYEYNPTGYYYLDTSTCSNLNASNLEIKIMAYDGTWDSDHSRNLQELKITDQTLNGVPTSGYSTNFGSGFNMAEGQLYTYKINGPVPQPGIPLQLRLFCRVKAQCKSFWGSASITLYENIEIKIITYDKTALKNLVNSEKALNRQEQYFTAASWHIYEDAYSQAYAICGKPNTSQAEINDAYNNLNNAINSFLVYNAANYNGIDNLIMRIPTDYYNNPGYYTTASKTALDDALADINYDRTLDMRYQNAVNQMAINLSDAIDGLTYNTYTLSFSTDGGSIQPAISAPLFDVVFEPVFQSVKPFSVFVGWYSDPELTIPAEWPIIMPYGGMTLYAKWEPATANIVFDTKGGSSIPTYTGQINTTYGGPAQNPTKPGYDFDGWYYDNVAISSPVTWPIIIPESGRTLYAKWTPASYIISFDSTGGSSVAPITAEYGTTINKPTPNPIKTGYNFLNWYRDPELTQLVTWPMSVPSQNTTLYAKWSATEFTITFDTGCEIVIDEITAAVGTQITAPPPPIRDGYEFGGWYYSGEPYTFSTMPAMNLSLVANWIPLDFTIYFDSGEGTPIAPITQPCGSVVAPPLNPTWEGYLFDGWLLNGEPYAITEMPASDITLVASWRVMPDMSTIKLKTDLPEGTETLEKGDVITITLNVSTNYFAGSTQFVIFYDSRYYEPALNNRSFTEARQGVAFFNDYASTVENFSPDSPNWNLWETGSLSGRVNSKNLPGWGAYFPADWKSTPIIVLEEYEHYDYVQIQTNASRTSPAGGACIEVEPAQDFVTFQLRVKDDAPTTVEGEKARIVIPTESIKQTGLSDTGINLTSNRLYVYKMPGNDVASGQASYNGLEYDLSQADLNYNIIERTTLPEYIISFDCAGGSTVEPIEAEVGSSVEAPPAPTRTNYVFTGWTYNGEPVTWPLTMPGADITLVAQWEHKTANYTVYHYLQNVLGTGYNLSEEDTQQITANVGTNISAVPLSVDGFTYYADYSTSTGMVTEDNSLELHLYYTRNTYTISFDADGGNVVNPITQVYGSTVELPTTEKIGHTFVGWELNDVPYTLTTMPLGGASLKAIWSVTQYKMEFYINNVKDESLTIIQNYNSVVIAPSISPPDGYEFSGWSPEVPERMPAGDTQYYATLTSQGFKINYYVNNELERTDSYQAGETIEPLNYECPYGYEFSGWSPSLPDVMPDYDLNVYGTCSLKRVTVIFYLDGMEYDRITAQYGRPLEAPEVYVPDGYEFSGWSPEVPGTMPAENMEFYGSLSVIEYTINFYLNGELEKTITGPAGTLIVPPSVEEEGYSFSGWLPVAPLVMPTENMDVYGTLTILSYTVKFILDDETIYSEELEYGTPITSPEVEVPIGYSFSGWSPSVDATVPARDVTYTATLTANNYTITFYLNGEYYSAVTLPYGAAIAPIEVSVPDGYVFNGWSPEVPATMPAQNMNIYGTLSENTVTVSFDLNGGTGTVPAQITEVIGTQIALPAQGDITRESYNFLGWATTPDATEALESFVIPSQEQTLYAVWQLAELPELIAVEGTDTIVDHERNIIYGFTQGVNESSIFDYIGSLGNTRIELEYTFNIGTGTEVRLIDNATNEVLKTYYIVIFGDIDGDGRITSLDSSALLNVVSYNADISYDSPYYYAADIDGWSGISSIDASNLLNVVSFNADIDQTTGNVVI